MILDLELRSIFERMVFFLFCVASLKLAADKPSSRVDLSEEKSMILSVHVHEFGADVPSSR